MIEREEIEEIGKFLKTHALKGELNIQLDVDSGFIRPCIPLIIERDGILVPFFAESIRPKGHFASLVKLVGVDSEESAASFVNETVYALRRDVDQYMGEEETDEEGVYMDDMLDYTLIDSASQKEIGKVTRVDFSTANILFIVETSDGEEIFVPASEDLIVGVDKDKKIVAVNIPDGLLDLNIKKNKG